MEKQKKKCVIVRVDFEKAYDTISWCFLFYMMQSSSFYGTWIKWI